MFDELELFTVDCGVVAPVLADEMDICEIIIQEIDDLTAKWLAIGWTIEDNVALEEALVVDAAIIVVHPVPFVDCEWSI